MILLTTGPVPAKLDSVKYIGNRFKGELGLKTARTLLNFGHNVTIMKWKYLNLDTYGVNTITFDDIVEYRDIILNTEAKAYILSAAVANLMPTKPWKEKFPSHNYKAGEKFNVEFCISPRIIDEIKDRFPRSALIGYKLYDGSREELIKAAQKTLFNSRANIIFANTPQDAKTKKLMLTQDNAVIETSFYGHVEYIKQLLNSGYYRTEIDRYHVPMSDDIECLNNIYPRLVCGDRVYGCFAIRVDGGFVTTSRGKSNKDLVFVSKESGAGVIKASAKPTLNAPLLNDIMKYQPQYNVIIHDHKQIPGAPTFDYEFPGTYTECGLSFAAERLNASVFNIKHHGYIAMFKTIEECKKWIDVHG